jgi:uncharacterized membrane protein YebE (DUF533 family)
VDKTILIVSLSISGVLLVAAGYVGYLVYKEHKENKKKELSS